jgi:hypothetical protein
MAKATKRAKRPRAHKTSPNGRNHAHSKKTHVDTIGVSKWGVKWETNRPRDKTGQE